MGQLETQLISTLQALVLATKTIAASVAHAWYEVWLPPILTVLGWVALVLVNQKSNRDLLKLQRKELATNRIVDALDKYLEWLDDAGDPRRILWRDRMVLEQQAAIEKCKAKGVEPNGYNENVGRLAFCSLTSSDSRSNRWIDVLHRDAWTYNARQDIVNQVKTLVDSHGAIVSALIEFQLEQLSPDVKEGSPRPSLLLCNRDMASVNAIGLQETRVFTLRKELNSPNPSRHRKVQKEDL